MFGMKESEGNSMSTILSVWVLIMLLVTGCAEMDRPTLDANSYINLGNTYFVKREYDQAISNYNKAIEVNPKLAMAYNNRGIAYDNKGQYDQAIADYNKAIALDPRFAKAYLNRGIAYNNKGQYDRAISDYSKAIELNPNYAKAYNNRGDAHDNVGQYDQAIADYNKAIELNPNYAKAYNNRGDAHDNKGQYDQAIADYNKAIELNPRFAMAYNNLAWVLATCPDVRHRDGKRAIELAKNALELRESAIFLDTLAAAYAEAGMFQDAIKTQERAIALLKKEGRMELLDEDKEHLESYKAGKPWRDH